MLACATGFFIFLYAFIRWSEWWLRRRILRHLRYRHPNWRSTEQISRDMGCTMAAAITALSRLRLEGFVVSDNLDNRRQVYHRAIGIPNRLELREDCL